MRGLLSFSILWLLTKRDMYGQEIAEELAQRRGTKPNPGTLYPALAELEKRGHVESRPGRRAGRRPTPSPSRAGRAPGSPANTSAGHTGRSSWSTPPSKRPR